MTPLAMCTSQHHITAVNPPSYRGNNRLGGQALGPTAAGLAVDRYGAYQGAFLAFGINLAVVSLLMLTATRPGRETAGGEQRIGSEPVGPENG